MRQGLLLAAVALSFTTEAHSTDLPPSVDALLAKGGVWAVSHPDPDRVSARVEAAIDIAATPQKVWRTMTDCRNAYRLITNLKSCRVVQGDMAQGWDVREHITKGGLVPGLRIVFRSDYTAYSDISFKLVEGDLKVEQGEWRLVPLRNGTATRVIYRNRLALKLPVPQGLLADGLKKDTPRALIRLRDLCLEAAKP